MLKLRRVDGFRVFVFVLHAKKSRKTYIFREKKHTDTGTPPPTHTAVCPTKFSELSGE